VTTHGDVTLKTLTHRLLSSTEGEYMSMAHAMKAALRLLVPFFSLMSELLRFTVFRVLQ
jgi:hypothetical protein